MGKNEKNILRCACCDMKFDSRAECQEHFESEQHKMVAIMAWIRCVARMNQGIYGDGDIKSLFITESSNDGITVQSTEFFRKNLDRLGPIIKVRGYKDDDLDYWVEFSDRDRNVIRVSGFSWGYGGEGPNGLADACKLVGFPLTLSDIEGISMEANWKKVKSN
ncbi:MAG: hypothetical protein MUP27_09195 [Desulfobacterales bacterium]|nr:hypothetical protein [Desulfobacterales bacterium]